MIKINMILKTKKEDSNKRIDKFLTEKLDNYSRSKIQKLIKQKNILVNKLEVSVHYFLKENDKIEIEPELKIKKKKEAQKEQKENIKISIISNVDDYLIVNKPAGLIVHGAQHIEEITLADLLVKQYPQIKNIGEDESRPGIVHRLDKNASGLMAVAKSQKSFQNLKKQFQTRKIYKEYTALVYGVLSRDYGTINFPIKRSSKGHKMAAIPKDKQEMGAVLSTSNKMSSNLPSPATLGSGGGGKEAISEFEVIKKFINYTLLKVKIKTGRTHQIRVHLAAYGHPIVGDDLYSTKKTRILNKKINLGRIFLVANKLKFHNLNSELKEYEIDLPKDLKLFLKKVK